MIGVSLILSALDAPLPHSATVHRDVANAARGKLCGDFLRPRAMIGAQYTITGLFRSRAELSRASLAKLASIGILIAPGKWKLAYALLCRAFNKRAGARCSQILRFCETDLRDLQGDKFLLHVYDRVVRA